MALPWHIPLEALQALKPKAESSKPSLLKHMCSLNIHDNPIEELQTGLMCEIGIENKEPLTIQRLIASGMTVARLNLRDMEHDACTQLVQSIRQAVYNYSADLDYVYPLAIIVDVRGPDIVTGDLKGGPKATVEIAQFKVIRLTIDPSWRDCGTAECLFVAWDQLTELHREDVIFVNSLTPEKIKLVVQEVGEDSVECTVAVGGMIGSKMPVRISQIPREQDLQQKAHGDSIESLVCSNDTNQSFEHIEDQVAWAIGSDVDAVLVPNSQNVHDIQNVRSLLGEKGKHILVFACIDTVAALDDIDNILAEANGVYLDRSILSTDLAVEKVFIAQKTVFAKCNDLGKPCICKAVINEQIPTLCVTDIANLVLDGADVLALELHYDSPLKKFSPSFDAVRMAEDCLAAAGVVCRHSEHIVWQPKVYGNIELMQSPLNEPSKAISVCAVELSVRSNSAVIICLTNSGRTAKLLSHGKPLCPIVAVTRTCNTARQLRFWRGVRTMHYFENPKPSWAMEVDCRVRAALDYCKAKRFVSAGDAYVVVTGSRRGTGYCDTIRLLYASARDTVALE